MIVEYALLVEYIICHGKKGPNKKFASGDESSSRLCSDIQR